MEFYFLIECLKSKVNLFRGFLFLLNVYRLKNVNEVNKDVFLCGLHVKASNRLITIPLSWWPCVTPSQALSDQKILLPYISTNYCLFALQTDTQCTKAGPTPEKSRKNREHTTDLSASHVISIPNTKSCHNAIKPNLHPPLARPKPLHPHLSTMRLIPAC